MSRQTGQIGQTGQRSAQGTSSLPSLRAMRLERTLGLRELARAAGVSESTIYSIEHGIGTPRMPTIRKLARALGVSPRDIAWPGDPFAEIAD